MTLDEYKRYICNKISDLPVSSSTRINCHGMLILKEDAFVNMQKDPNYEKQILNMLGQGFQTQYPFYAPNFGYQVIGGTAKECYGEGVPINSGSRSVSVSSESWWQKRHERTENYIRIGQRGSLASRLESNRQSRIQERAAQREGESVITERSGQVYGNFGNYTSGYPWYVQQIFGTGS